jgi:hypothetical protein
MTGMSRVLARLLDLLAFDVGPSGVVAFVVGHDDETIDCCICADDEAVEERSRLLLDLYAGDATAVLFATVRPGPPDARPGERARFRRLRAHGRRVGLPVFDWFVVGDDGSRQSLSVSVSYVPPERQ